MNPWASMAARISSPIGPSSTRRMWAVDLNRKGSDGDGGGHDVVEWRHVHPDHVERPDLGLLDRVLFGTERALAEDLDAVLAAGPLVDQFAHVHDGLNRRIVERMDIGRTEFLSLGRGRCEGHGCQESR